MFIAMFSATRATTALQDQVLDLALSAPKTTPLMTAGSQAADKGQGKPTYGRSSPKPTACSKSTRRPRSPPGPAVGRVAKAPEAGWNPALRGFQVKIAEMQSQLPSLIQSIVLFKERSLETPERGLAPPNEPAPETPRPACGKTVRKA